jgi:hypothetical protein
MGLVALTLEGGATTDVATRAVVRIEGPTPAEIEDGEMWTIVHFIDGDEQIVLEPPSEVRKLLNAAGIR